MPKKQKLKPLVTFQLVHRSQQDPLVSDENAPQHVFVPITKESKEYKEKRLEDQQSYGIYYDDDCNYLEHLKDRKDNRVHWPDHAEETLQKKLEERAQPKLKLPSSVFPSEIEEEVGMLNKATPVTGLQLHLDREVVAAMDEDFDYDDPNNQLEDNFIDLAGSEVSEEELVPSYDSEEMDNEGSLEGIEGTFSKPETRSRFTEYSLSCSNVGRNPKQKLIDATFEYFPDQYVDSQIGALDMEQIEGHLSTEDPMFKMCMANYEKERKLQQLDTPIIDDKTREYILTSAEAPQEFEIMKVEQTITEEKNRNYRSASSTHPKYLNLPRIIEIPSKNNKITVDKRTGIPKDTLGKHKLTKQALRRLDQENTQRNDIDSQSSIGESITSQLSELSIRPKGETPDERRKRKQALKEYRKERRVEKKQTSILFKEANKKQHQAALNKINTVGTKIL